MVTLWQKFELHNFEELYFLNERFFNCFDILVAEGRSFWSDFNKSKSRAAIGRQSWIGKLDNFDPRN